MNDSQGSPIKMDSPHSARESEERHGHVWCIGVKETLQMKPLFSQNWPSHVMKCESKSAQSFPSSKNLLGTREDGRFFLPRLISNDLVVAM